MRGAVNIVNIHSRSLGASLEQVGALIDSLSSPGDRLWPTDKWPAMKFDRSLKIGAKGGHGPVRYEVVLYQPGRRIRFQFNADRGPCVGLYGYHEFEVLQAAGGRTILRHVLKGRAYGAMALRWSLVFRWLHDALIEDALDNAEKALSGSIGRPAHWSPAIHALRGLVRATA